MKTPTTDFATIYANGAMKAAAMMLTPEECRRAGLAERLTEILREEAVAGLSEVLDEAEAVTKSAMGRSDSFIRTWMNVQCSAVASRAVARFRDEKPRRDLTCSVCGEEAGQFEQHPNRDTGFGICARCVAWVQTRGMDAAEVSSLYGVAGVNYAGN